MNDVSEMLQRMNGSRFCLVYMPYRNRSEKKAKMTSTVKGTAKVINNHLVVAEANGNQIEIPDSALQSVFTSDGSDLLGDADFFLIIRPDIP